MGIEYIRLSNERHSTLGSFSLGAGNLISIAAWFRINSVTGGEFKTILSISDKDSSNNAALIFVNGAAIWYFVDSADGGNASVIGGNLTVGRWYSVVIVERTNSSRDLYLDGTKYHNTDIQDWPVNLDTISIGAEQVSTGWFHHMDGDIAHVCIWDGFTLTDADTTSLAAGKHPLSISAGNISHFWEAKGDGPAGNLIRDVISGLNLDIVNGTPTKTDSIKLRNRRVL